ncbi:MAG: HAD hydrolase-like protein [Phormidesmis sp.]
MLTCHFSHSTIASVNNSSIKGVTGGRVAKQVVFCDFDGPIVDVSERYYQTYCKGLIAVEQMYGHTSETPLHILPLSKVQFWQMKQNRVADIDIAVRSGLPAELFSPFMQQVERIVNHPSLLRWDRIQPTAQSALNYFRRYDFRLVIVTLRHPRQVQSFLQAHGLAHLIDEVYGASDVRAAHANRVEQKCELLKAAIAQQKTQGHLTDSSWMIGDTEADIVAGQSLGLSTAALSCGVRSEAYLRQLGPSKIYDCLLSAAYKAVESATILRAA